MAILEPLMEYNSVYKPEFKDRTAQYFEELVRRSGVDEAENAETVKKYHEVMSHKREYEKKLTAAKTGKVFSIIFTVAGFIAAILGILDVAGLLTLGLGSTVDIVMIVVGILLGIGLILLVTLYLNKKIAELRGIVADLTNKANGIQQDAYAEMAPLNNLFSYDVTAKLIHDVLPMVSINRYLDGGFNAMMVKNFGFAELTDTTKSTLNVLSGTYYNSPFVTENNLVHEMGLKLYFGELTITWTETYEDSEGNTHTRTRTEILHAEVSKPFPEYHEVTSTLFLSDAAPDLIFTRGPKLEGDESERELDRIIRRGEKKIDRLAEKALKNGDDFTGLNNSEFDVLFDALDRNDEMEFNLLFTPAAQDNMTDLIKSKEPYGDDFYYHKNGKYNVIMSEHMQGYDIDFDENKFKSFDLSESRRLFNDYNNDFFEHFYFEMAPIFSIPAFQDYAQNKYKSAESNMTTSLREATALANHMVGCFAPRDASTKTILKLQYAGKDGDLDKYVVNALAYRGEPRVDYIPRRGGDGYIHQVPVPWIEYIPTESQRYLWVADLWKDTVAKNEFLASNNITSTFGVDPAQAVGNNGLLGFTNSIGTVSSVQLEAFHRAMSGSENKNGIN